LLHTPVSLQFLSNLLIDSGLNSLLSVLSLSEPVKTAVSIGVPTLEDLENLFLDLADDESKVRAMLEHVLDESIVTHHDIHRIMFFFQWFMLNIVDPDFQWPNFTRSVYVAHKRAAGLAKQISSGMAPGEKLDAPSVAASAFNFSVVVLATNAKRQATPVAPGTVATLKPHKLWKSPFAANTRKGHPIQLHSTELVLKFSLAIDVIEFYEKLVAASKPPEIDLIPFSSFDPACALWPNNRCSDLISEMNDALALRLDQTGTLNLDDETINILYQKHILDSTSGVHAYAFLYLLLKKEKRHLHDHMPTSTSIDQATTIGYFGADLERYYLHMATIVNAFEEKPQSRFFLSALQKTGIEVDRFVDRLDSVAANDPLPEELTLTKLILRIKDIRSLQPSSTSLIHRHVRPTDGRDNSTSCQHRPPPLSHSCLSHPPQPDSHPQPLCDFRNGTDTQCVCGCWGHSVENCQELAIHFLLAKHLQKDANLTSSSLFSERWCIVNEQNSRYERSIIRAIRDMLPGEMAMMSCWSTTRSMTPSRILSRPVFCGDRK
jgi:hypothetical protein